MALKGRKFNVAIDGPAGAGKSTVARLVAQALGFLYVDTGAMYRAVTWKALKNGVEPGQTERLKELLSRTKLKMSAENGQQRVYVDNVDVTDEIRSVEVHQNVSKYAQMLLIRQFLVEKQKELAKDKGVVMDGRDIGTHVLPDAEVKIYLTASVKERARRRYQEAKEKYPGMTLEQWEKEIESRDRMDMERPISPLTQAEDAIPIDSTGMDIPQVVDRILEICRTKTSGAK